MGEPVYFGVRHLSPAASFHLRKALDEGIISGAGVDVLSTEPPKADNPLLHSEKCIITPHIAWASFEARTRLMGIFRENVKAFLEGKPINVVN